MNATRRLAKKTGNLVNFSFDSGTSTQNILIQGILILILIVYSAVIINSVPVDFLKFFDNIIVKIVVLVIIAFVGLYSPAVALFIAIALICTLQMYQKKQVIGGIRSAEKEKIMTALQNTKNNLIKETEDIKDNFANYSGYLDPEVMGAKEGSNNQNDQLFANDNTSSLGFRGQNFAQAQERDYVGTPSADYLPAKKTPKESSDDPQGFNTNATCLSCSNGGDKDPSLDSQCGNVRTWKNQFSAQGLGMDITGFQSAVGYPV